MRKSGTEIHRVLDDRARNTIVSHLMGLLDGPASAAFERHVDAGCAACREELNALNGVAALLRLGAPLATPPARLRERILKIPRASHTMRAEEGSWKPFNKGVAMKTLDYDAASRSSTALCRMEPGSSVPPHHHWGQEQCYVVQGEVEIEGQIFRAGDYVRESAGTDHAAIYSKTGCLLLLVTCLDEHMAG